LIPKIFNALKFFLLHIGKGYENMISWKNVQEKFPWSIVIFTGGAFALVKGVEVRIGKKNSSFFI
jgi:Na+/H+ antiporter NhaD/arsenite permease-like protein